MNITKKSDRKLSNPLLLTPLASTSTGSHAGTPIMRAVVFCEGNFAKGDGKTANGLIRHSDIYQIVSVVDSTCAGQDSGEILDGQKNGIPIFSDLKQAVTAVESTPHTLIYGVAPANGRLPKAHREIILEAISLGLNIVCGLHEYLTDDSEILTASQAKKVTVSDIRKPPPNSKMRVFDGSVADMDTIRIAVLGTDCAIGKRTTATILAAALVEKGIHTVLIGTGQTGLMQGARYGIAMDALAPQFCCGQLEGEIVKAYREQHPKVILIEGQGALSHPAFCTSAFILRGSQPHGVVLQHAPKRIARCDFPHMDMPTPETEIALIESFADTKVIGLTLNHEGMKSDSEIQTWTEQLAAQLDLPVTDALSRPNNELVNMVTSAFPSLAATLQANQA